jgi:BCCT family betaine/carnitine transporter
MPAADPPRAPGEPPSSPNRRIDRTLFSLAVFVIAGVCLPLGLMPERAGPVVTAAYDWIATQLGLLYLWFAIGTTGFVGWLALGHYGEVRLGDEDDRPEFSTFSWVAMLFCAGVGAGLLYWAAIEWAGYYVEPPRGALPRSAQAIEWATAYGLFHWGPVAWCLYALPTLAIAHPYYVKKVPFLRASTSCHALLGPRGENGLLARGIDLLFMLGLLGGAATSLGLVSPMIAAVFAALFGLETSVGLELVGIALCMGLFGLSVYLGLERGIKRLSDLNAVLALALLAYVIAAGPTLFILRMGTDSIGFMFDRLVPMLTWTDPIERTGFVENWTIFYWAWWIAYGPFVGLFVTRISRGRTIRQVIVNMVAFGSLGGWLFFVIIGDYALHLELEGILSVTGAIASDGRAAAIAQVIGSLPLPGLTLAVFGLTSIVFAATTYDSASYALAAAATANLRPGEDPRRRHRLFWAVALGLLPALLLYVGSRQDGDSLQVVLSATLVTSLPLVFVGVAMGWSLLRSLRDGTRGSPP